MINPRVIVIGVVAVAFVGLGAYAWDADNALSKCKLAREDDRNKALQEAQIRKSLDEEVTKALIAKHDEEVAALQQEVQNREDAIRNAAVPTCDTPALDAFLRGVRDRQIRASGGDTNKPASK